MAVVPEDFDCKEDYSRVNVVDTSKKKQRSLTPFAEGVVRIIKSDLQDVEKSLEIVRSELRFIQIKKSDLLQNWRRLKRKESQLKDDLKIYSKPT